MKNNLEVKYLLNYTIIFRIFAFALEHLGMCEITLITY